MLEQVLNHIHNWFQVGIYHGEYAIENGVITLPFLQNGQYFRIVGSLFNDGLYIYDNTIQKTDLEEDEPGNGEEETELTDETFTGAVWALAVPKAVVKLAEEISLWQEKYGDSIASPYTSESFAGYSYTKTAGIFQDGWQAAFRSRLNPYRKLKVI